MAITFHKMHGLGNDFVILDAREEPIAVDREFARALCDRRTGIGCDQLIRLSLADGADLRMDIWNADGGVAEACGNATRCIVALTGAATIETDGGLLSGTADGATVSVTLEPPKFGWNEIPLADPMNTAPLPLAWDDLSAPDAVNVGNPHLVFFVEDTDGVWLEELGPRIETDPAFPDRINVNCAEITADGIKLRTWERGAGLTLACGTGACATAVAAIRRKLVQSPVTVTMPGGSLSIEWAPGQPIIMHGPATHVFSGTLEPEAFA